MKIIQINVGGFDNNFTYLIIGKNNESILIDPTGDLKEIEKEITSNHAKIVAALFTHSHPDHCELAKYFSKFAKTIFPKNKKLGEEEELEVAGIKIEITHTPGHTKDSVVYKIENNLFSGDTIFCKGVGTTAYGGDLEELKESLNYLFTLDQNFILWPGHNYGGNTCKLKEALKNSHIHPSENALKKIHEMVNKYESNLNNKKVFLKNKE